MLDQPLHDDYECNQTIILESQQSLTVVQAIPGSNRSLDTILREHLRVSANA